ncbi:uncharacterized protein JN550_008896 [Neoarthrinium moseri]|uniref:uncharacterized protein n=1 Tax=Neoarthrinium moseri TaxID=1658444 RepID=UPI001FDC129D|nr:uncharacterized protein JN550_008896 [Neoarthrinium moseri]KAI1864339.1 hypothetical protein JN550_008896 [Neoarthrinium moseri]
MDYVLKLPNELLLLISQSCDHMHDLGALSLTCRRFHSIFDKLLYERAVTGHHYLLTWACETGNIGLVAKLLDAGADPNRPFGTTRRQARYRIFGAYRNAYVEDFYGLSPDVNFLDPFVVLDFVYGHRSHVSERLGEAGELPSPISDESAGLPASGAGENSEDSLGDSNDDLHDSSMDEVGSLEADFSDYNTTTDDDDPSLSENELLSGTPTRFECSWYPLHAAARHGSQETLELLIKHDAHLSPPSTGYCRCRPLRDGEEGDEASEPDALPPDWTPLHTAVCCGNAHAANLLISYGCPLYLDARPNHYGDGTTTVYHTAAFHGCLSSLQSAHDKYPGLDIHQRDCQGNTPLQLAHRGSQNLDVMHWLVKQGADPNTKVNGCSVLHVACLFGWFRLAMDYILAGANCVDALWENSDASEADIEGIDDLYVVRPLDLCCTRPHPWYIEMCGVMPEYPFDVSPPNRGPQLQSLAAATDHDRHNLVKLIISKGASVQGMKQFDLDKLLRGKGDLFPLAITSAPPMFLATQARFFPIMELLLQAGASVDDRNICEETPLASVLRGSLPSSRIVGGSCIVETVNWLLDNSIDTTWRADALSDICSRQEPQTAEEARVQIVVATLLLNRGAKVNAKDEDEDDPLSLAFTAKRFDLCDLLIRHGAALANTVEGLQNMLERLLGPGYSIDPPCGFVECFHVQGEHTSTFQRETERERERELYSEGLRWLLRRDKAGHFGRHPRTLWLASQAPDLGVSNLLLAAGADDATWVSKEGKTCLHNLARLRTPIPNAAFLAQEFLARGACITQSTLHMAIIGRRWDLVRLFFQRGAQLLLHPPTPDETGFMMSHNSNPISLLLMHSLTADDYSNIDLCLKNLGLPISAVPEAAYECLREACTFPVHPRALASILKAGADVNERGPSGATAINILRKAMQRNLHMSIGPDRDKPEDLVNTLQILIEGGADPGPKISSGREPSLYNFLKKQSHILVPDFLPNWDPSYPYMIGLHQQIRMRCVLKDSELSVNGYTLVVKDDFSL